MEKVRHRPEARTRSAVLPGFTACSQCDEPTRTEDLYASAAGEICPQCTVADELDDALRRDLREQAKSVFLMPGFLGLALMVFQPLLRIFPEATWLLAGVPLVGVGVAAAAFLAAGRSRGDLNGRVWLGLAALSTLLISLLGVYVFYGA